jgi:3-isopropylmalate dehydrogenase
MTIKIAVVPGDGVGAEVIAAVLPALELLAGSYRLDLGYDVFDWGADKWLADGIGLPAGAIETLSREYAAVLLGALGDPRIPDMAHGREILLGLRRGLDLYVNYRPVLVDGRTIHLYRENTQGLYAGTGGMLTRGRAVEVAVDECVYTRSTVTKFIRFCLGDASARGCSKVTLVHKANAVPNTGGLWLDIFRNELLRYPALTSTSEYVDSFCYNLVRSPAAYECVLASNLFGDIISDIGAALMGGLGLAPSASLCPETRFGLFEPVHGSAPDIAGRGIANPCGAAMSTVLMLEHFGMHQAADLLRSGVADALSSAPTADLGGTCTTVAFMAEVLRHMRASASAGTVAAQREDAASGLDRLHTIR